jgi:hypothetical protein
LLELALFGPGICVRKFTDTPCNTPMHGASSLDRLKEAIGWNRDVHYGYQILPCLFVEI